MKMKKEGLTKVEDGTAVLTVVVPAYNVEKYIEKCLESLLLQSVIAHKVIVVDDGSKDMTGGIAKKYASKYPDLITYLYQENAGLGAARNVGMKYVNTPYTCFLDSDDWLLPRTVERIMDALHRELEEPDIIFMTPKVYNMATKRYEDWNDNQQLFGIFEGLTVTCPSEKPEMYALEASVCRCVWRSEFLKEYDFSFPEGIKWEDVFPHFYLFHWARRCILVRDAGFCYRINSGNQITSLVSDARLDIITVFASTLAYAMEHNWSDIEIAYIINMMIQFSQWSLVASTSAVQRRMVKSLHFLYRAVPKYYYQVYQKELRPGRKRYLLWRLLRTPVLYHLLSDYHLVENGQRIIKKMRLLKGRVHK